MFVTACVDSHDSKFFEQPFTSGHQPFVLADSALISPSNFAVTIDYHHCRVPIERITTLSIVNQNINRI